MFRFIRQVRDKLAEQEKAFQQELQKASFACKEFSKVADVIFPYY